MTESPTRTVERALGLLAIVCDSGSSSLAEASRATNLAPSTALRLLRTLEVSGFVRRHDDGTYRPGSRIMQLGAQALSNDSLVDLCHPAMKQLVEDTGESVYLSVEGHRSTALYIHIIEGTHSVRHTSWVGRTIPLESSAAGAVILGRTPPTGYVVVERGIEPDVTAIAAPVRSDSRIVAVMSLVIPSYRVSTLEAERYGGMLTAATTRVSAGLGKDLLVTTAGAA